MYYPCILKTSQRFISLVYDKVFSRLETRFQEARFKALHPQASDGDFELSKTYIRSIRGPAFSRIRAGRSVMNRSVDHHKYGSFYKLIGITS